jgi:hypothetical protein
MVQPTQKRTIPVGILVSVSESSGKPRMTKGVLAPPGQGSPRRTVPWSSVLLAGSAVWTLAIALFAVLSLGAEPRVADAPREKPLPKFKAPPVAEDGQPPKAPEAPAPVLEEEEGPDLALELPPMPPPLPPGPKLVLRRPNVEAEPEPDAIPEEPAAPVKPAQVCAANLGTTIHFVKDPPDAFRQARKEKKLVFMIHLSGNFEEKEFT